MLTRLEFRSSVWFSPFAKTKKNVLMFQLASVKEGWRLLRLSQNSLVRATFHQILHLRDWLSSEALFSKLHWCLCRGFIALENKTFIIEPVSAQTTGSHLIYRVEELRLTPGACGHGFNMSSVAPENHIKSPFQSFRTRVRWVLCCFYVKACITAIGYQSSELYYHQFEQFL